LTGIPGDDDPGTAATDGGSPTVPRGSSRKRERQHAHIKESYEDRGASKDEAEERAARTVNEQSVEHGETRRSS